MPVRQYKSNNRNLREYDTTKLLQEGHVARLSFDDRDINPAPRSNIPMEQATWSAKHMINSIYGVIGNVPNQKMTYDDIWKTAANIR